MTYLGYIVGNVHGTADYSGKEEQATIDASPGIIGGRVLRANWLGLITLGGLLRWL